MNRSTVVVLVAVLLVAAGAVCGQDEPKQWRGKIGYFSPTETSLDGGIALGGERLLQTNKPGRETAIELDYAQCSSGPVNVDVYYLLYTDRRLTPTGYYWGWGAGLCRLSAGVGWISASETDLAWQVCGGMQKARQSYELRYVSGGRNGNTGFMLTAAMRF